MKANPILFIITVILSIISLACTTRHINPELAYFAESTQVIGKNSAAIFKQFQQEELNMLAHSLTSQTHVKPSDFDPKSMTDTRLSLRQDICNHLYNYAQLLQTLLQRDHSKTIRSNSYLFYQNIQAINRNHKNFLTDREIGILTTLTMSLQQVVSFAQKKKITSKIMRNMQPILEKTIRSLVQEIESIRIIYNNYYLQTMMNQISEKWPDKVSKRLSLSKKGVKLNLKKRKMDQLIEHTIPALELIPSIHKQLILQLSHPAQPVQALSDLIDFSYRISETYREFSNLER